jgi:hypothetical protein
MMPLLALVFVFAAMPFAAGAQTGQPAPAGLVPCGTGPAPVTPCKLSDFIPLIKKILNFLILISAPIGALAVAIGGGMYLFSGPNPKLQGTAKTILTDAFVGLLIVFGAWLIVNTILTGLVKEGELTNFSALEQIK